MPGRFRKPQGYPKLTLCIVLIGGGLAIILDLFVFGGIKYITPKKHAIPQAQEVVVVQPQYVPVEEYLGIEIQEADEPFVDDFVAKMPIAGATPEMPRTAFIISPPVADDVMSAPEIAAGQTQYWEQYAASFQPAAGDEGKPMIVIIIDDLGLNATKSKRVVDLPSPLTLAYLPYADSLKAQTAAAREAGHELLIHTPMEPMSRKTDPGPGALLESMSDEELVAAFEKILASFDGYIGINNHMGSRLTQDADAMAIIMQMLKDRELVFVDSKTAPGSVAANTAKDVGVFYAERDVFLDHEETPEFVQAALARLEQTARRNGLAIAIGHPKDVTVEALAAWIPTLEEKGLVLAPVSAVLNHE